MKYSFSSNNIETPSSFPQASCPPVSQSYSTPGQGQPATLYPSISNSSTISDYPPSNYPSTVFNYPSNVSNYPSTVSNNPPSNSIPASLNPSIPNSNFSNVPPIIPSIYVQQPQQQNYDINNNEKLNNIIFLGTRGKIRAMELINGVATEMWTRKLEGCKQHMVHLIYQRNIPLLFAACDGSIFCFDPLNGLLKWSGKPKQQNSIIFSHSNLVTLLASKDQPLIYSASNGAIVATNIMSGQIVWEAPLERNYFKLEKESSYTLLEQQGLLFVGSEGHVYAYSVVDGRFVWRHKIQKCEHGPVTLAFNPLSNLLFAGSQGRVIILNSQSGIEKQTLILRKKEKPVAMLFDPSTNSLFAAVRDELYCIVTGNNNTILWKSKLPKMGDSFPHSLLLIDDRKILIGMRGKVVCIDRLTGKEDWKTILPGSEHHMVTVAASPTPNEIVCTSAGKMYILNITSDAGSVSWKAKIKDMGSHICVSTSVHNTDFSSTTLPINKELKRKEEEEILEVLGFIFQPEMLIFDAIF